MKENSNDDKCTRNSVHEIPQYTLLPEIGTKFRSSYL